MNNPLVDQINSKRRQRQLFVFGTVGVLLASLSHVLITVVSPYL